MKDRFLSSEGRIGRVVYFIRIMLLIALAGLFSSYAIETFSHFQHGTFRPMGIFLGIVASVFCAFAGLMQLLKRLHDMGKDAYLSILMLLPGANILFLLYTFVAPSKEG